jgi:hypothetical protein
VQRNGGELDVVILLDEYDAPVTVYLPENPKMALEIVKNVLVPFYSVFKSSSQRFRKVFVTGVSKFSSTTMFSGTNNFTMIMEMTPKYSTLFGFTASEIINTYGEYILKRFKDHRSYKEFKDNDEMLLLAVMSDLKHYYNGYRVHPKQKEKVFNPMSIVSFFAAMELESYWAKTGLSSSIVEMIGIHSLNLYNGFWLSKNALFKSISAGEYLNEWMQCSFQAGYVTILEIKEGESENNPLLYLGPPNQELRDWLKGTEFLGSLNIDTDELGCFAEALCLRNFGSTEKQLETFLNRSVFKPKNEEEFRCMVYHALYITNKFEAISIQIPFSLEWDLTVDNSIPKRGYAQKIFDAGVMFRHNGVRSVVVMELKYEYKNVEDALNQLLQNRRMRRAQECFQDNYTVQINGTSSPMLIMEENVFGIGINIMTKRGTEEIKVQFSKIQNLAEVGKHWDDKAKSAYEQAQQNEERIVEPKGKRQKNSRS